MNNKLWRSASLAITLLGVCACGTSGSSHASATSACVPAPIHHGAPPSWSAAAWSSSSPGFRVPYALASGDTAGAFFFADPIHAGHPENPSNKVLWIVGSRRDGQPLRIVARRTGSSQAVRMQFPADSSPGEIYPSGVDLPTAGCWKLSLAWGAHRASIDVEVAPPRPGQGDSAAKPKPIDTGPVPASERAVAVAPLHGAKLTGRTGLRLLVADDPPFVLDVDTGNVTRVTGVPTGDHPVLTVEQAGRDAVIWVDHRTGAPQRYVLRHGTTHAVPLASAPDVGRELAGQAARSRHAHARLHGAQLWALAGDYALGNGPGSGPPLTLTGLRTGARRRLAWPSAIRFTDEAVLAPGGRLLAVDFADPAYRATGTQVTDVWLLDPATGTWRHVPGTPASVHLKFTSFAWAPGGRLVLLAGPNGPRAGNNVVAVWKPRQRRLALRRFVLPARTSGSDAFLIW
ncbi:MAG TPA: hypothetical protein VGF93_10320 [Solirubrobacteraceae bacterium]